MQQVDQISTLKKRITTQFKASFQKLKDEKRKLASEKKEWNDECERVKGLSAEAGEIIDLNVGGKNDFSIRRSTLCGVPGSALEALFSGRHAL